MDHQLTSNDRLKPVMTAGLVNMHIDWSIANLVLLASVAFFLHNWFFSYKKKSFQEPSQSVKLFESRLERMLCGSWSRSKLFPKIISRWQKMTLATKELNEMKFAPRFGFAQYWQHFWWSITKTGNCLHSENDFFAILRWMAIEID